MSGDGPLKSAPPGAPPLDDIILGEDDLISSQPPAPNEVDALAKAIEAGAGSLPPGEDRASQRPSRAGERSSNRVKAAEPQKERKRQKLTLRIPDDEVSRPQLPDSRTPLGGIPSIGPSLNESQPRSQSSLPAVSTPPRSPSRPPSDPDMAPLMPNRIISLDGPTMPSASAMPAAPATFRADLDPEDTLVLTRGELEARGHFVGEGIAPGIDREDQAGWTPFQPMVADHVDLPPSVPPPAYAEMTKIRDPQRTILDADGMGAMAMMREYGQHDSTPPVSEDIPIETDDESVSSFEDAITHPRLPVALDSEEIKIEETGERHTDPGEVPEIDADDLVSVESIPTPNHHAPPLKSAPGSGKGSPSSPPMITATSLMANMPVAVPAAAPLPAVAAPLGPIAPTPVAPAVIAKKTPSIIPAPAPTPSQPRLELQLPAPTPAAGLQAARRPQTGAQNNPFGHMPTLGALAPPPMNEGAANRKKVRPWWEDLFNDDFIRTMAKITDSDIVREANFIEESLGCEAGATILDLACGTGRHAVELARRGYQVVGYDLSLAMLARASDEAQERKQKINFVQGDMREMTFEETFDGVFSWNTSFGYFEDEKNAQIVAKIHRSLKKGGQFLLDVVNRDSVIRQAPSLAWFEGDGCICMDEMQIDFITSRMKVKRTLMMDDGRTKEIEYSIRVYSLHELGKMLHDNGFRVAEVSGGTGTPGVFFGCEAPRTLILAEKR